MRKFAYLLLGLCLLAPAFGQSAVYEWRSIDADEMSLWRDGAQIGNLRLDTGVYQPRLAPGEWGKPCRPPYPPPDGVIRPPTGVMTNELPQGEHHYHRGKEIDREEVFRLLGCQPLIQGAGDKKIPDDSQKLRVSVIGSAEKCAGPLAVAKKHPEFVAVDYRPDKWMIQRQGFVAKADPTIYIQEPNGKDRRRLDGYRGDAAFEAVLTREAGRKIGPNEGYDPAKDKGWDDAEPAPFVNIFKQLPWLPAGILAGLGILAIARRKPKL